MNTLANLVLGPIEGILGLVTLAMLAVKLFAFVDAVIRPEPLWRAADVPLAKTWWLVLLGLGILFNGLGFLGLAGLVAAIVYLVDVRPKLQSLRGGPRGGGGSSSDGPYGPYRR